MVDLRRLPDILRGAGLPVVEYPGWTTRGRSGTFAPRALVVHHDASAVGPSPNLARFIAEIGTERTPPPLSQLWLDTAGRWHVLAAGRANHAGLGHGWGVIPADSGNAYSIGVETDHTVEEPWPQVQLDSLLVGVAAICGAYGWSPHDALCGHREYTARKVDPDGVDMDQFRRHVADRIAGGPADMTPEQAQQLAAVFAKTDYMDNKVKYLAERQAWSDGVLYEIRAALGALTGLVTGLVDSGGSLTAEQAAVAAERGAQAALATLGVALDRVDDQPAG